MKKSEFHRIYCKGKVVIKNLNYGLMTLQGLSFAEDNQLLAQEKLTESIFLLSIEVAVLCCGSDQWADVSRYLSETGVEVPEALNYDMTYLE